MAVSGTVKGLEWKKSNKWQGERQFGCERIFLSSMKKVNKKFQGKCE